MVQIVTAEAPGDEDDGDVDDDANHDDHDADNVGEDDSNEDNDDVHAGGDGVIVIASQLQSE